ncbi:unnamed protein product [Miscanthus lutarioriparius]|uniref:Glycosyl transferase 64 domain-containing protein n=1 Tax=Miscanthus lutarioriparius TaxID=422564 RepID=A0A811S280_9POAL|nr:unnamed protein product [Miscanthus lutarioriparius]
MPRMAKLLLKLQAVAAADRRHGPGPGPGRRHPLAPRYAPAATRFVPPCRALCLLALAAAATTLALALTLQNHRLGPAYPSSSAAAISPRDGFAVVINTWRRPALLRRSVAHYSACGGVDAVHVVWSEPRPLPPETLRGGVLGLNGTRRGGAGVRFEINDADSLNNRFRPIRGLVADAVFSVDDDLIVPCSTLRFAFLNCEDIAMAFLVANATGAPPVWVQGRIFEIGSSGISSLKGHGLQRSRCLNAFAAMYGHMPLVATTVKAVDSRRSWFW